MEFGFLQVADVSYLGEGNYNIVCALKNSNKVLRIPKLVPDSDVIADEYTSREFLEEVTAPLIGRQFVRIGVVVFVSYKFLEDLELHLQTIRPASRLARPINLSNNRCLLFDNCLLLPATINSSAPVWAVEIKPKSGFLPTSNYMSAEVKKTVSRYQMMQRYKLSRGEIQTISEFCPLSLFSNSIDRMRQSVAAMVDDPQNNFKLFKDGVKIFDESLPFPDAHVVELCSASRSAKENIVDLVTLMLSTCGVLQHILAIQKLDIFDVEGVVLFVDRLRSLQGCSVIHESVPHQYFKEIVNMFHAGTLIEHIQDVEPDSATEEQCWIVIAMFLLAAAAKDCSILIAFQPINSLQDLDSTAESVQAVAQESGQPFRYRVSAIDCDVKPVSKIGHYLSLDMKIVQVYHEMSVRLSSPP